MFFRDRSDRGIRAHNLPSSSLFSYIDSSIFIYLAHLTALCSRSPAVARSLPASKNLWDCGGQENFLAHFISTQKSEIFKNVAVLIYVFDATTPTSYSSPAASGSGSGSGSGTGTGVASEGPSSPLSDHLNGQVGIGNNGNGNNNGNGEERTETEWERDVKYFEECIEALYSLAQEEQTETDPSAPVVPPKVWVLVNKMDIVGDGVASKKIKVFEEKRDEIERRCGAVGKRFGMDVGRGRGVRCFGTSIWDESLYKVGRSQTPEGHFTDG
jgi:Ras-related GTP-binding protein A/B